MKKIAIQFFIIVFVFFGLWITLSQLNWIKIFKVENVQASMEQKLGKLIWENIEKTEHVNDNQFIKETIDSIVNIICNFNKIDKKSLHIHILNSKEINAYALPDGHLVILTGLIKEVDNAEALAGVIGHEIAHIKQHHVMQKLIKDIGLSVLLAQAAGNTGAGKSIGEIVKLLNSTAFDRELEKKADLKSVEYLLNANINPVYFAEFLYKIADDEIDTSKILNWISTHPDSKIRAEYIIDQSNITKKKFNTIIDFNTWERLKLELEKEAFF